VDHLTTNRKFLYDVDGNILTDKHHRLLNIYRENLQEALSKGDVRIFRNKTMSDYCYRYFITSQEQLDKFYEDRAFGSNVGPNKKYHVYVDEDCNKNTPYYKSNFSNSIYG
jgi:hypothetical protein